MPRGHINDHCFYKCFKLLRIVAVFITAILFLTACSAQSNSEKPIDIDFKADGKIPDAVKNFALEYVESQVNYYINDCDYPITKAKITALTRVETDSKLGDDVHVWRLEYRIKPKDPDKIVLAGGMRLEDGWITEWGSTGQPYLVLVHHTADDSWLCIGSTNTLTVAEEYGGNYSQAAIDMYNKYMWGVDGSDYVEIPTNAMYSLFDSGKSLSVGLTLEGEDYNTYTSDNRLHAERFAAIMSGYNWVKTDTPRTDPSKFQLTVSSADESASFTFWQSDSAEFVEYVNGGVSTCWQVMSKDGTTGIAEAMRFEYDNLDANYARISFEKKGSPEEVAETFVKDVYAEHLLGLVPQGNYSIKDYEVLDWGVDKVSDDKDAILGWVEYAVVPQEINSSGLMAGNTTEGSGEYDGWLIMSRYFVLEKKADARWHCIDIGTGGGALPEN